MAPEAAIKTTPRRSTARRRIALRGMKLMIRHQIAAMTGTRTACDRHGVEPLGRAADPDAFLSPSQADAHGEQQAHDETRRRDADDGNPNRGSEAVILDGRGAGGFGGWRGGQLRLCAAVEDDQIHAEQDHGGADGDLPIDRFAPAR